MIRNHIAIKAPLFGAALLLATGVFAQSRAVQSTNFELAVESTDSDTSGSTSNGTLGANLRGTLPLGGLFGVSLNGEYSRSRVRTRDVLAIDDGSNSAIRPSCSFENTGGEVSLFVRRPTLGKIALSYGIGQLSADCSVNSVFLPTGDDSLDSDRQRLDVDLYLGNFTLGGSYTELNLDDAPKLETTTMSASWYPLDSLKISLSGNDQYEENTYGIFVEHQPEFLGNGFGVNIGYAKTDGEPNTRAISIGLSYYFGTSVTLKDRDRHYR